VMPPWPSTFAGALASKALAEAALVADVAARPESAEAVLEELLGSGHGVLGTGLLKEGEPVFPLPTDLTVLEGPRAVPVKPKRLGEFDGAASSIATPALPVLTDPDRSKPRSEYWLGIEGLRCHLAGEPPGPDHLVPVKDLWKMDARLGIALQHGTRTAAQGLLYTTDAVCLTPGVRILVGFRSAEALHGGLLRLGGDGRGAVVETVPDAVAEKLRDLGRPERGWRGFRMVLATPGIFPEGWLPPGRCEDGLYGLCGVTARLEAARVGRYAVVSGWDLARQKPKKAVRVVPAGSVYWFSVRSGDTSALEELYDNGLWSLIRENERDPARRREGFNRVWFGYWNPEEG